MAYWHKPGSVVVAEHGLAGSVTSVIVLSRASAKYARVVAPVLVTATGTETGAPPADRVVLWCRGRPGAVADAVLNPIRPASAVDVCLPEEGTSFKTKRHRPDSGFARN